MADNLYLNELQRLADSDVKALEHAEKSYGDSWKRRGGVGAFMMLARKWDRIENRLSKPPGTAAGPLFDRYDVFGAVMADNRAEGVIDDIRDLRRYLMLVEADLIANGRCPGVLAKDIEAGVASKGGTQKPIPLSEHLVAACEGEFPAVTYIDHTNRATGISHRGVNKIQDFLEEKLGKSAIAECRLKAGLKAPDLITLSYWPHYAGQLLSLMEREFGIERLLEVLSYADSQEIDDTPPASVLHPR